MKYYETFFDEYIQTKNNFDLHPELDTIIKKMPDSINNLNNLILYGPSGTGKYSTSLKIINKYSSNNLKYDKKITVSTDKQTYNCKISDIHYEIDLSLLGCNSKLLWHEIFFRIVDIISMKKEKTGIILCKNFHLIHSELLENFYSYMQQYNHNQANIKIIFIIISEQISFLPLQIIKSCQTINIKRPIKKLYSKYISLLNQNYIEKNKNIYDFSRYVYNQNKIKSKSKNNYNIFENIDENGILNIKELNSFQIIENTNQEIPGDSFNIICDKIIKEINNIQHLNYTEFRDILYDTLTYNLDIGECIWYIISYYVSTKQLNEKNLSLLMIDIYSFFKYFNNNYRPIYHLETIFYHIINKVHNLDENSRSI